jgi:hypothetical protein
LQNHIAGITEWPRIIYGRAPGALIATGTSIRYAALMSFSPADLEAIDRAREVDIETQPPEGDPHRVTIWAVVDDDDVFIRSWKGDSARWYQDIQANPGVAIHVDGRRIPATAIPATDPDSVERTSNGFRTKYKGDPGAEQMCAERILDTTLRIEPT